VNGSVRGERDGNDGKEDESDQRGKEGGDKGGRRKEEKMTGGQGLFPPFCVSGRGRERKKKNAPLTTLFPSHGAEKEKENHFYPSIPSKKKKKKEKGKEGEQANLEKSNLYSHF